jgi:tetratricopeptide (TPR) repeat protein/predicted Ser/Thr protein kinase
LSGNDPSAGPPTPCLDDNALALLLAGEGPADERARAAAHLDQCEACRSLVGLACRTEAALAAEGPPAARGVLAAGTGLGRYVVLETSGAGAMGVVYAAWDPQLHRRVALKLLRPDPTSETQSEPARSRLLREAQALARLSHPNVVTVHDVGTLDGEVFLAMEFVEGGTLRDWMQAGERAPREALALLRQAGEGLAAAHEAGLVHRDFKPDNVLVGSDGRVRVTDFGLARAAADETVAALPREPTHELQTLLTDTGALVGTPAYMAPEVRRGERADARSDLYSFAVTLHEALTGVRPRAGGRVRRMPARLERLIARGLADAPAARWPSMRALLAELDRGPLVSAVRLGTGVLVLALVAAVALGLRGPPPCPPPAHAFDGIWDGARRVEIARALTGTRLASAGAAIGRINRRFDAWRDAWIATEIDTCQATRVRGEQSERLLDLRMTCLDERKHALAAASSVLATADAAVAARAVEIVDGLPSIAPCSNASSLAQVLALPDDGARRAAIRAAFARLYDASALLDAGKVAGARAIVEEVVPEAESLAYPPLLARALYLRGAVLYDSTSSDADKQRAFVRAAASAVEGRDDNAAAAAFVSLVRITSWRPEIAREWNELAAASIRRLGGDDALEGRRLLEMGRLELGAAHLEQARALLLRARPLLERAGGPEFSLLASVDQSLGNAALEEKKWPEAEAYHQRALDLRRKLFGRDHPATISSTFNSAEDRIAQKQPAEARRILRDIEELPGIEQREEGGWLSMKLGAVALLEGDPQGALGRFEAARRIYERTADKDSRLLADIDARIGDALLAQRRPADAIAPLTRAVAIYDQTGSDDGLGAYLASLATALWDAGHDHQRAIAVMKRALAVSARQPSEAEAAARARTWLAAHDAPAR